jgi:peptide deformylase
MALLPIIIAPDPRLKQIAAPVARVDERIRRLMDDMLETMYLAPGIGLAAPQVGVLERVIVVDASAKDEERAPLRLANPELIEVSEEDVNYEEGCLSLPEHYAEVVRPAQVRVRYLDHENEIRELDAEGLLGTCIQHEMDHLEGILFVDHLSALKRNMILRKLTKFKKAEAKGSDKAPTGAPAAAE